MAVGHDRHWWDKLRVAAVLAVAAGVVARPHFDAMVRLSRERRMPATTVFILLSMATVLVSLVGRKHPRLALLALSALSFGASASWLALTENRFSGPVMATIGRDHGVHLTDPAAVVPAAVGLALLVKALRLTLRTIGATTGPVRTTGAARATSAAGAARG